MYLFSENIIEIIYNQTKLYNVQSDPSRPLDISIDEMKSFLGICWIMSCVDVSNIRDYWSDSLGNKLIRETMSINCFEKIRGFLHFTDNRAAALEDSSQFDRLYKIRTIIDILRNNFQNIPMEECLSLDEQICPTKARSYLKQYRAAKPHKWGFKFFVLCRVSSFA